MKRLNANAKTKLLILLWIISGVRCLATMQLQKVQSQDQAQALALQHMQDANQYMNADNVEKALESAAAAKKYMELGKVLEATPASPTAQKQWPPQQQGAFAAQKSADLQQQAQKASANADQLAKARATLGIGPEAEAARKADTRTEAQKQSDIAKQQEALAQKIKGMSFDEPKPAMQWPPQQGSFAAQKVADKAAADQAAADKAAEERKAATGAIFQVASDRQAAARAEAERVAADKAAAERKAATGAIFQAASDRQAAARAEAERVAAEKVALDKAAADKIASEKAAEKAAADKAAAVEQNIAQAAKTEKVVAAQTAAQTTAEKAKRLDEQAKAAVEKAKLAADKAKAASGLKVVTETLAAKKAQMDADKATSDAKKAATQAAAAEEKLWTEKKAALKVAADKAEALAESTADKARDQLRAAEVESEQQRKNLQQKLGLTDKEATEMARFAAIKMRLPEVDDDIKNLKAKIQTINAQTAQTEADKKALQDLNATLQASQKTKENMQKEHDELAKGMDPKKLEAYNPSAQRSDAVKAADEAVRQADENLKNTRLINLATQKELDAQQKAPQLAAEKAKAAAEKTAAEKAVVVAQWAAMTQAEKSQIARDAADRYQAMLKPGEKWSEAGRKEVFDQVRQEAVAAKEARASAQAEIATLKAVPKEAAQSQVLKQDAAVAALLIKPKAEGAFTVEYAKESGSAKTFQSATPTQGAAQRNILGSSREDAAQKAQTEILKNQYEQSFKTGQYKDLSETQKNAIRADVEKFESMTGDQKKSFLADTEQKTVTAKKLLDAYLETEAGKKLSPKEAMQLNKDPEKAVQLLGLDKQAAENKEGLTTAQKAAIGGAVVGGVAGGLGVGLGLGLGLPEEQTTSSGGSVFFVAPAQ